MNPQQPAYNPNPAGPINNAAAPAAGPNVPATWPGAWGLYKYSKAAVMLNVWDLIGVILLSVVISSVLASALKSTGRMIGDLLSLFFSITTCLIFLAGARGERLSFGQALQKSLNPMLILKFIVLSIAMGFGLVISFLLLIVPFFIILPRVILAPYYLVDKNSGIGEALNASWATTKGNAGKIYGVIGAGVAMALLAITIIGIPFAIYFSIMYSAATAIAYYYFANAASNPAAAAPAPVPAQPAPPVAPAAV